MRISDWSSDVCSSDLHLGGGDAHHAQRAAAMPLISMQNQTHMPGWPDGQRAAHPPVRQGGTTQRPPPRSVPSEEMASAKPDETRSGYSAPPAGARHEAETACSSR